MSTYFNNEEDFQTFKSFFNNWDSVGGEQNMIYIFATGNIFIQLLVLKLIKGNLIIRTKIKCLDYQLAVILVAFRSFMVLDII